MRNHDGRLSVKDGLANLHTYWDFIDCDKRELLAMRLATLLKL